MKKNILNLTFLVMSIILFSFITSCDNDDDDNNEVTGVNLEDKKETCLELSRAIMNGAWDKVDELLDDNFTYVGDAAPAIGKQEYIAFMKNVLTTAMTDMDMNFVRVIAEGDLVAVEYTNQMTHSGEFYGVPATNNRVTATGHFIREVKDGKITAEWQTTNAMGLMGQIGGLGKK